MSEALKTSDVVGTDFVFIPLNLPIGKKRAKNPATLAVVSKRDEHLKRFPWTNWESGVVYRLYRDGKNQCTEQLAHAVLGLPPYSPTFFRNRDPFDCRVENIAVAAHRGYAMKCVEHYAPESVIKTLPGYAEALKSRHEEVARHLLELDSAGHLGRPARLKTSQIQTILEEVLTGSLKRGSLSDIQAFIKAQFQCSPGLTQINNMLRGKALKVPGYNYDELVKVREANMPNRAKAAQLAWKRRRGEIPDVSGNSNT